jgi:hypothetical protein
MSDASRRFPPVSGPDGWAGVAGLLAAGACEVLAVFGIMEAAFNNDLGHAAPWFVVFLLSLPLTAAGAWLLRLGWKRAGTLECGHSSQQTSQPPSQCENPA